MEKTVDRVHNFPGKVENSRIMNFFVFLENGINQIFATKISDVIHLFVMDSLQIMRPIFLLDNCALAC